MRIHHLIGWMLVLGLFGSQAYGDDSKASGKSAAAVTVERVEYHGWPEAWRIRNGACELVIVPAVTRVMRFALTGGKNLLWEDPALAGKTFPADDGTWHNVGGEKLWPTQQKDLFKKYTGHDGWPPPWPWDAGASRAEPIANGVRLVLPHDKRFGAHAVREFTLNEKLPLVHVRQWIEKTEGPPAEVTVWTVCQANDPVLSLLPCADGKFSIIGSHSSLIESKPGYVTLGRDAKEGLKIGVPAAGQNGWVASVFNGPSGKVMLVQSHRLVEGAKYPDDGLQAELYTSPRSFALYTEMELLSPLVALKPGERLEDDRVWQVVPVEGNEYLGAARRAHAQALERLKPLEPK
jgi:hypothetical protein